MNTIWVGQEQFLSHDGRYFRHTEPAVDAIINLIWANGILAKPSCTYYNGKVSHDVAHEVISESEGILLDCQVFF